MVRETPLFTMSRALILSKIDAAEKQNKDLTIDGLAKETGLSRASIYLHLRTLKSRKLIKEKRDIKKLGQPIYLTTNKADPIPLKLLEQFKLIFPNLFK